MQKRFLLLLPLFFLGCTGLEKSEKEKLRDRNAKGEYVYRHHHEVFYPLSSPRHRHREAYPWEHPREKAEEK